MQRALAVVLGLVAALVACLFVLLARPSPRPESAEAVAIDPRPELRAILEELRGLRADLRVSSGGEARENVDAKPHRDVSLERALEKLVAALEAREATRAPSLAPRRSPAATGSATIDEIGSSNDDATAKHRFWTLQDIRDRYGEPEFTYVNGGTLRLMYRRPAAPSRSVEFELLDGVVVVVRQTN